MSERTTGASEQAAQASELAAGTGDQAQAAVPDAQPNAASLDGAASDVVAPDVAVRDVAAPHPSAAAPQPAAGVVQSESAGAGAETESADGASARMSHDDSPKATATTLRHRLLYEENLRATAAMVAATVVGLATSRIYPMTGQNRALYIFATALLGGWFAFSFVHAWLSWRAYRHLSGDRLRQAVLSDKASFVKRKGFSEAMLGSGTTSFAGSVVSMALVGVMVLVMFPDLRSETLLLFMGAALVVIAWLDLAVTFAVQYARENLTRGGLDFPGDEASAFDDYLYFAAGVQSTFGTTDVSITTTSMRTTVRNHGLMAFCFNTVIVAMLVSLVLTLR